MTPFGLKLTDLRNARKMSNDDLARGLKVQASHLTAVMNGFHGVPSPVLLFQIERVLQLSRFEMEELKAAARLSNPQPNISTTGLSPEATELVNLLAIHIARLPQARIEDLLGRLKKYIQKL